MPAKNVLPRKENRFKNRTCMRKAVLDPVAPVGGYALNYSFRSFVTSSFNLGM